MDWTTPRTWVDQELVTAELLNTQWRDNMSFLYEPPAARVYNDASINIANAAWTAIAFNSERFDNDEMHDDINSRRLTCKTAGRYLIFGSVFFNPNVNGIRRLAIRLNGTTYLAASGLLSADATNGADLSVATVYELSVDQYVELLVYQNSGAALAVTVWSQSSPEFGMVRIG